MKSTSPALVLALLAPLAAGDHITLVDGSELRSVEVQSETLAKVTYKESGSEKSVDADKVLAIEFTNKPPLLEQLDSSLSDGDAQGAIDLADQLAESGGGRKWPWSQTRGAWLSIDLRLRFGDFPGAASKAAAFLEAHADSRYTPMVYLAKAEAESRSGEDAKAQATLDAFQGAIESKSLSRRWDFENRLAKARLGKGALEDRRKALTAVASDAESGFPTVAARARLAEGEALLAEAEKNVAERAKAEGMRKEAEGVLKVVTTSAAADEATLAGAYTGLAECLFYRGADPTDPAVLEQAAENGLRVAVLYPNEQQYAPKALFLAARSFDLMQNRDRKFDMRRALERDYPDSPWTEQARRLLR